jgi:hypothetical protein
MMSKKRIAGIAVCVVIVAGVSYRLMRPRTDVTADAYVGERTATVWSTLAAVRQPVATLRFGQKVGVIERRGDQVHVRLPSGELGWLDSRLLMDAALWDRGTKLLEQTRKMPLQGAGHTKVSTNVRIEAGRTATRLCQFMRDVPVEIFARASAEWGPAEEGSSRESAGEDTKPKREDWILVRGQVPTAPDNGSLSGGGSAAPPARVDAVNAVAGWVVARFIELDLPETVKDYSASSGMRVLAWFELNRVPEEPGGSVTKPQYLVAGVRGGEGHTCDFNALRVYTWGAKRRRYETAYVESDLCGYLPIRVANSPAGEPEFRFQAQQRGAREERVYRLKQTSVRRVHEPNEPPPPRKHAAAAKHR